LADITDFTTSVYVARAAGAARWHGQCLRMDAASGRQTVRQVESTRAERKADAEGKKAPQAEAEGEVGGREGG
jgi:hypothetical protein